jgi:hypothetical protein
LPKLEIQHRMLDWFHHHRYLFYWRFIAVNFFDLKCNHD